MALRAGHASAPVAAAQTLRCMPDQIAVRVFASVSSLPLWCVCDSRLVASCANSVTVSEDKHVFLSPTMHEKRTDQKE